MPPFKHLRIVPTASLEPEPEHEEKPLWPELIEEDFDEVVAMIGRFAVYHGTFSMPDLEDHFAKNNVLLPEENKEWRSLFAEMQDVIVQQYAERGEERQWVAMKAGKVTTYALAYVERGDQAAASHIATPEPTVVTPKAQPVAIPPQPAGEAIGTKLQGIFATAGNDLLRPNDILEALGESRDHVTAKKKLAEAVKDGHLVRVPQKGTTYFGLPDTLDIEEEKNDVDARGKEPHDRPIDEAEVKLAINVLDTLTARGAQAKQVQTIKTLEQAFGSDFSRQGFRKILRALEAQRLITINGSYSKNRKSPRVTLSEQDIKKRWSLDRDGCIEHIGRISVKP